MVHQLPSLPYPYDALEPYFDARTMEIHHTKHHQGYVDKLNAALEKYPAFQARSLEALLTNLAEIPEAIRTTVRNQGGGHFNHSFFWPSLKPGGSRPTPALLAKLNQAFGDFSSFQRRWTEAALGLFGSGWIWLIQDERGRLSITTTPNQDNPLSQGSRPLLGLDLWEHAYYLKYQNRRADYLEAWWSIVNWEGVERLSSKR